MALKPGEQDGVVVRLRNLAQDGAQLGVRADSLQRAAVTDLYEQDDAPLAVQDKGCETPAAGRAIVTLRLQ